MNNDSAATKKLKKTGLVLLFVLPALFFYGTFNLFGIARTFYYSAMDWKGISANKVFVGLSNYVAVAKDMNFWNALEQFDLGYGIHVYPDAGGAFAGAFD